MASRRELEALITLSGRISPTLQNALRQTQRGIGGISSSSNLMGKALNKSFDLATKAVKIGSAAVGAGIAYVGVKGTQLASDLTEVQNVVDTTFGKNSKVIDAWSVTTLKSFGLSELSAKQYSSTMGAMLKSSGLSAASTLIMSKNLTGLSGDFASFYNKNPEDMFAAIQSGISGETEPLKKLGINMSVANLQAYALSKGIKTSYSEMDQASQTTLRYNYLLSVSKDAQGDFAKTSGSFSNQLKVGKEALGQLAAKIMSAALPGLTKLLNYGNKLLDGAMGNPEFIKKFQDIMTSGMDKLIDSVPKVIDYFQQWWPVLQTVYDIGVSVFDFINNNWSLIEPIIWGIVAAQIAFNVAAKAALIIEAVTKAYAVANTMIRIYRSGMGLATVAQWALNAAMTANPIGVVTVAIGLLVAAGVLLYKNWETVSSKFSQIWTSIEDMFKRGVNSVIDDINKFTGLLNKIPGVNIPVIANLQTSEMKAQTLREGRGTIPQFAKGGFANKPSIFGEAGLEAAIPIIPGNARSIALLNQTASMLGVSNLSLQGKNNVDTGNFNISQTAPLEMPILSNPRNLSTVVNNSQINNTQTNSSNYVAPVQLVYSPTIQGGSTNEIETKLKAQAEEFKSWIEDYFAEKARVALG